MKTKTRVGLLILIQSLQLLEEDAEPLSKNRHFRDIPIQAKLKAFEEKGKDAMKEYEHCDQKIKRDNRKLFYYLQGCCRHSRSSPAESDCEHYEAVCFAQLLHQLVLAIEEATSIGERNWRVSRHAYI